MKKRLLPTTALFIGIVILLAFSACDPCKKDPCNCVEMPQDDRSFDEQVHAYLKHNQEVQESTIIKGQYAAYFDFSDGMEWAYTKGGNNNKEAVRQVLRTVFDRKCEIYGLESGKIVSLQSLSDQSVYNLICKDKYEKIEAPIQKALEEIVKNKKPSLLVTDFEEYTLDENLKAKGVAGNNYADESFQSWLKMGGVIKFFIADFKEKGLDKKLFFVVFDSNDKQFIDQIENSLKTSGVVFRTYMIQATPYRVFTDYPVGKGGNYIRPNGIDPLGFEFAILEDLNTETYVIPLRSWLQTVEELMYYRNNPNENFTGLISRLYVDISDSNSININKLMLKVTDITDDFYGFTKNTYAKSFAPTKGEDGSIGELTCEQRYFYDASGELLPSYQYLPSKPVEVTKERFIEINQDAFERSRSAHSNKTEIVIDFGKEFTDTTMFKNDGGVYQLLKHDQLKEKMNGRILKLDVCITEREVKMNHQELEEFFNFKSYEIRNGQKTREVCNNKSITNSVDEALYNLKKIDNPTVIYTYIIKDNSDAE